jgi:signal transduction histidine kinase
MNDRWLQCPDGTRKYVQTLTFPIKKTGGVMLCGITRDITEDRLAKEQQLKLSFEQERVTMMASFIQDVSHEFRTPLSVIYTGLGIIERTSETHQQVRDWTARIKSQITYIHEVVDAMLILSRLDSSADLERVDRDLNTLLSYVATTVDSQVREKKLTLVTDLADDLPPVRVNETYLHRSLKNICQNAIQFTLPGGTITLRSRRQAASVVIEVQDTGVGIDEEDLPFIFNRFYRADKARTSRQAGLGLPITQRIIELHQGTITVESTPGQGSLFRVVLPAAH